MSALMDKMLENIGLWAPYSKKYHGISRIINHRDEKGVRFDIAVAPAIENSDAKAPNVTVPSGVHPWLCSPDYSFYSYRFDLEWKDKVYADISFARLSKDSVLIRTQFFNNSELNQICILNLFSAIEFPFIKRAQPTLPENSIYIDALSYDLFNFADSRPWDMQTMDALKKGEFLDENFTCQKGLGDRDDNRYILPKFKAFGESKNDEVRYVFEKTSFKKPALFVRYRTVSQKDAVFLLNDKKVIFPHSDNLRIEKFLIDNTDTLHFLSLGEGGIELDFLAVCEEDSDVSVSYEENKYNPIIEYTDFDDGKLVSYFYDGVDDKICLRTFNKSTRYRNINTGCIEDCPSSRISQSDPSFNNILEPFSNSFSEKKSDPGFYHNTALHSIYIKPNSSHTEYVVASFGETQYLDTDSYEKIYLEKLSSLPKDEYNGEGRTYALSNEILKATVFQNLVYPVYHHGEYIAHLTPGKRWDSFYTWDSGFIGLDMALFAPSLSLDILDTYLSDEANPDYAFLLHGSPVPTHIYQLFELFCKRDDKESLKVYYPKAKHFYDFLSGKIRGSKTDKFNTGLTTTFDYFYNCSGMDDLPAQKAMYEQSLQMHMAPCISTSQLIRCAKILYILADYYGVEDDKDAYLNDISLRTDALQKYSWDEESGYFSYVLHDENGDYICKFKNSNGENLNKGIDGIYPLIAGAVNDKEKNIILSHLKSDDELFTPVGISAVDRTASYYIDNGYWNGNVWMSHQWFIWKTMLDISENDFAYKIADTALKTWKREVEYSYYTFEMFNIKSGRGGWFHNFGGLSTPVNLWAHAYYVPGTVSTGFDTMTKNISFETGFESAKFSFCHYGKNDFTILVTMKERDEKYKVLLCGEEIDFILRDKSCLEIKLNGDIKEGKIEIK